jgi:hypothetical protein
MSSGIHPRFPLKNPYSCIQQKFHCHVPLFNFVGNSYLLHNNHIFRPFGYSVLYVHVTRKGPQRKITQHISILVRGNARRYRKLHNDELITCTVRQISHEWRKSRRIKWARHAACREDQIFIQNCNQTP